MPKCWLHFRNQREKRLQVARPAEGEYEVLDLSFKPPKVDPVLQPYPHIHPTAPFLLLPPSMTIFHPYLLPTPPPPPPLPVQVWTPMAPPPPMPHSAEVHPGRPSSPPLAVRKKNSYKDAPKLITCPVEGCSQKFPWNSSLKRHILTHTRELRTHLGSILAGSFKI